VLPAVRARFNDLPILLVGTKSDTRQGTNVPDEFNTFFHVNTAGPDYHQVHSHDSLTIRQRQM
jgi:GTPase SAR1 family protein